MLAAAATPMQPLTLTPSRCRFRHFARHCRHASCRFQRLCLFALLPPGARPPRFIRDAAEVPPRLLPHTRRFAAAKAD
jgi:hypothetical protein